MHEISDELLNNLTDQEVISLKSIMNKIYTKIENELRDDRCYSETKKDSE
jgi:hypothetical protein